LSSTRHPPRIFIARRPVYNGKVENLIGLLKRKMFTVLKASGLGMQYWPEAFQYCVYTYNRMPTRANVDDLSPYHMYRQRPPRLSHLRAFGCDCTHWCKKSMSKGTGRAGIFLGYTPKSPSGTYRIGVKGKRTGTMVDSRHVIFDEHQVLPKFLDKTKHSHIPDDVNNLLKEAPKHKSAKRVTFALQGGKPNDVVNQDGNFSTEGGRKSKRVIGNPKTMIWQKFDDQPRTVLKQSACTDKDKIKINPLSTPTKIPTGSLKYDRD